MVVPLDYITSGSSGSATITNTGIRDEVIFSDILDTDTYDRIYGTFRLNAGASDFIVGMLSFTDDNLIVFNRNSIHLIAGSSDPNTATSQLITGELGCVARRTITKIGNNITFLSDNGLYSLTFEDLYNLRGNDTPLSINIQKTIDRINKSYIDKCIGVYFDNKYYLAAPLDDESRNTSVIVYNFLNKQWESVDSVDDSTWSITDMVVAGDKQYRGVYCINPDGGVHQIDAREDDVDTIITQIGSSQKILLLLEPQ